MAFDIKDVQGKVTLFKIWDVKKKKWWATPTYKKEIWLSKQAAKNAIRFHLGKSYKDCFNKLKIIQFVTIDLRVIDD